MVAPEQQSLDLLAQEHGEYLLKADADRHTDQVHSNNIPNQYHPLHQVYQLLCKLRLRLRFYNKSDYVVNTHFDLKRKPT